VDLIVPLFLIIFGLLSMVFTTGLWIYHNELIRKNLTTKEELKDVYKLPFGNPFYRSFCKNVKQALCPVIPKISLLNRMRLKKLKTKIDRTKIVRNIFLKKINLVLG
jgi:hypothetical protein